MTDKLVLMSHHLCPYVQRAVIALEEKGIPYERKYIDLANKPDWFLEISPLGKTPVLTVNDTPLFESSAILEYLEDTQLYPLHPVDAIERARHRAWMEFGSSVLNDIAGLYNAKTAFDFDLKVKTLSAKFARLENELTEAPYFDTSGFSLIDVIFGPVFRYFDVFDVIDNFGVISNKPKVSRWRKTLSEHSSIRTAVSSDYDERLWQFLLNRKSHLSTLMH